MEMNYPLGVTVFLLPQNEGFKIDIEYDSHYLTADDIKWFKLHLLSTLDAILRAPSAALADIDMDTPRPLTPNSDPATSSRLPSQLHTRSIIPQKPSKGSTVTLHRWFPSVPRPVRKRGPDIPIPALESKLHMLTLDVDEPVPSGAAVAQGPAVRSSVTTQTCSGSDGEADESVVGAQILGERGFRGL